MGTGWRRAFCTSIRRDPDRTTAGERQQSPSPRSGTKMGFFSVGGGGGDSNPSTPRVQPQPLASSPGLRCRTKLPAADSQDSPRLQCKTPTAASWSPRLLFQGSSNPSSPRSPSRFALLKTSLRLSRSSCGVCLHSVKTGQGTAIFTAECAHAFHFPCIAAHVRKNGSLVCPVCRATWRQVPLLSGHGLHQPKQPPEEDGREKGEQEVDKDRVGVEQGRTEPVKLGRGRTRADSAVSEHKLHRGKTEGKGGESKTGSDGTKVYDDDEPLLPAAGCGGSRAARFIPIPEADDEDEEQGDEGVGEGGEFQGFFAMTAAPHNPLLSVMRSPSPRAREATHHPPRAAGGDLLVSILPEVALLSEGRSHDTYVVALKVKAPPPPASTSTRSSPTAPLLDPSRRAPIDLVTVLDVSDSMTGSKLHMLKRAMRLVVSSLGPADRLSIVAFSTSSKRLLPLRRMSPQGQRSARRVVDRLVCGQGTCVGDALRKGTKVLEDRRERNPVASIMLLSDGQQQQGEHHHHHREPRDGSHCCRPLPTSSTTTRFAHLEIPVHASGFGDGPQQQSHEPAEDAFAKCVGGLLSVVLQDVRLQLSFPAGEISAVYSCGRRPTALGCAGGSIRLGDLYAEEERDLLVELRVPASGAGQHDNQQYAMSVRCCCRDPAIQEVVHCPEQPLLVPLPLLHYHNRRRDPALLGSSLSSPSSSPKVERLRNLFITTRALADSRRLAEHGDFATAVHLLASARSLLLQSSSISAEESLRSLEAGLAELQWLRQQRRRTYRDNPPPLGPAAAEDSGSAEPLTPTSAWRAAERLAKVAIMRKSLNRVSDLHGFENARF